MFAAQSAAEQHFAALLLCLIVVLALGRLVGGLFRRIKQPIVIGEILVGIALGPSLLGVVWPDAQEFLFNASDVPCFKLVASLGLVLFMFIVGLEVDLQVVRRSGKRAAAISLTSIALPFALGFFVLGHYLYEDHKCVTVDAAASAEAAPCSPPSDEVADKISDRDAAIAKATAAGEDVPAKLTSKQTDFVPFAVFIAVSMCVTAFPVLARILTERNMFKIPLGLLMVACAAIDDIMAFTLLALATALAGEGNASDIVFILGKLAIYVVVLFVAVRPLIERFVLRPYRRNGNVLKTEQLVLLFIGLMASSYITSKIGVHELIGGFLFGVAVPRDNAPNLFHNIAGKIEGVSVSLLLPVFFVIAGQGVRLQGLGVSDIVPIIAIILVACLGKMAGGIFAARVVGVPKRQSLAVGALMNTRGLTELVVLTIGRDAGVIGDKIYTMLVIMAIVTTAMAGPLLNLVYPDRWLHRDIAEAERARISSATDRVVVLVRDPATAAPLAQLAAAYGGGRKTGSVTLLRFSDQRDGLAAFADDLGEMKALRETVEAAGLTCQVVSRATADWVADTVAEVQRLAPSAVVIEPGDTEVAARVRDTGADVLVVHASIAAAGGVRVAGGGSNDELAAVEIGARVAMHAGVPFVDSATTGRSARQLRTLGIATSTAADAAGNVVTIGRDPSDDVQVLSGSRDRVALTETLSTWVPKEPLVLSPI